VYAAENLDVVAEPNLFGESSDTLGREYRKKGAHGGNWFPP
jgi:hypothetical protein